MSKLKETLRSAIIESGLEDGMTISFHHHLRNGDYVLNMVLDEIAAMGIHNLTVNASSIFDVHEPIIEHIKNKIVTGLEVNYMGAKVGKAITEGIMEEPVIFRSHGGRAGDMEKGTSRIDVAFIAAPCADEMGNLSGKYGPSACGSMGYAFSDAMYGKKVIAVTDHMEPYPLLDTSIPEGYVDMVVLVDKIGDATKIVSGTTRITKDPVGLRIAYMASQVVKHSGYLKDGFSFQTGAGGASLAVAKYVEEIMEKENIQGSFCMGGTTGYLVSMVKKGYFKTLLDVQCFDMEAIESIRSNVSHQEISASRYASPQAKSCAIDSLDVVILGATQVDLDFNVNVHTDSKGYIMGGSGGHCDTAAGSKLSIVVAPLIRARLPLIVDEVLCKSTPGVTVDVVVTQRGIAVNPNRKELKEQLLEAGLPVVDIRELKETAEAITGAPEKIQIDGRVVAKVLYRDGTQIDTIKSLNKAVEQ